MGTQRQRQHEPRQHHELRDAKLDDGEVLRERSGRFAAQPRERPEDAADEEADRQQREIQDAADGSDLRVAERLNQPVAALQVGEFVGEDGRQFLGS
jgi:hypothetical protein